MYSSTNLHSRIGCWQPSGSLNGRPRLVPFPPPPHRHSDPLPLRQRLVAAGLFGGLDGRPRFAVVAGLREGAGEPGKSLRLQLRRQAELEGAAVSGDGRGLFAPIVQGDGEPEVGFGLRRVGGGRAGEGGSGRLPAVACPQTHAFFEVQMHHFHIQP
jgi:hypothetical protein